MYSSYCTAVVVQGGQCGRIKVSSVHVATSTTHLSFSPTEYGENKKDDAGWDGRTRLARPNSQARTGSGGKKNLCSDDHEQDWQPYPVDPYSARGDDHTYINTTYYKCTAVTLYKADSAAGPKSAVCARSYINNATGSLLK